MPLRTAASSSSAETVQRMDGNELKISLQKEVDDETSAEMPGAPAALSRADPESQPHGSPCEAVAAEGPGAFPHGREASTKQESEGCAPGEPETEKRLEPATHHLWDRTVGASVASDSANAVDGSANVALRPASRAGACSVPRDGADAQAILGGSLPAETKDTPSSLAPSDGGGDALSQGRKGVEGSSLVPAPSPDSAGPQRGVRAAAKSLVRGSNRQPACSSGSALGDPGGFAWARGQIAGAAGDLESSGPAQEIDALPSAAVGDPCEVCHGDEASEKSQASAPVCSGVLGEGNEVGALGDESSKKDSLASKRKAGAASAASSGRSASLASVSRGESNAKKSLTSTPPLDGAASKRPSVSKCRKGASAATAAAGRRGREDCGRHFLGPGQVKKVRRNVGDVLASPLHPPTLSPFQRPTSKRPASGGFSRKYEDASPFARGHGAHSHPYHWLAVSHASGGSAGGRGNHGSHGGASGGGAGRAGALSEKVRRLVEQTMSEKHRVVWIDRGEAKGFLPLPGMQEERVYLVWTEKGIDILADVQAYIPWTHCPVLMQTKYRRNQIPFLILSSTSLALLFSHVCRRSATAAFRLPLARTPHAYRKHVLNLLRTGEPEKPSSQTSKTQRRRSPCSSPSPNARVKVSSQGEKSPPDAASASVGDAEAGSRAVSARSTSSPSLSPFGCLESEATEPSFSAAAASLPDETRAGKTAGDACFHALEPFALTPAPSLSPLAVPSPSQAECPPVENGPCAGAHQRDEGQVCTAVEGSSAHGDQGQQARVKGEGGESTAAQGLGGLSVALAAGVGNNGALHGVDAPQDAKAAPGKDTEHVQSLGGPEKATKPEEVPRTEQAPSESLRRQDDQATSKSPTPPSSPGGDQCASHSTAPSTGSGSPLPGDAAVCASPSSASARLGCGVRGSPQGFPGASKDGSRGTADARAASPSLQEREEEDDEDLFWANGGKKGCPLTAVDMRDFYCCSQGKVIGEDYIYFRQYLPDDEGADTYDLSVSVRKRPKKLLLKKSRVFASGSYTGGSGRREERNSSPPSCLFKSGSVGAASSLFSGALASAAGHDASVPASGLGENEGEETKAVVGDAGEAGVEGSGADGAGKDEGVRSSADPGKANRHPAHLLRLLVAPNRGHAHAEEAAKEPEETARGAAGCKNWTYVDDYEDDGMDPDLDLPFSFTSEVRVLLGLAPSPTPHRCNMSLASHRVSGAVQRRFRIFQCSPDGERREEQVDPFEPASAASASGDEDEEATGKGADDKENEAANPERKEGGSCSVDGAGPGEQAWDRTPVKGERDVNLCADQAKAAADTAKKASVSALADETKDEESSFSVSAPSGPAAHPGTTLTSEPGRQVEDKKSGEEARDTKARGGCAGGDEEGETSRSSKAEAGGEAVMAAEDQDRIPDEQDEPATAQSCSKASSDQGDSDEDSDEDRRKPKGRNETRSFALSSHDLPNGSLAEVDYPTEFSQFREADRIRIYDKAFLARALQLIVDVAIVSRGADLSAVNVAQYAPNLFWNIIRFSRGNKDIDEVVRTIAPSVASLRSARGRRKRGDTENPSFLSLAPGRFGASRRGGESLRDDSQTACRRLKRNKTGTDDGFCLETWLAGSGDEKGRGERARDREGAVDKAKQREEKRQKELEERFEEMKIEFEEKAQRMIARRAALAGEIYNDGKGSKKPRVPSLPENDDEALIEIMIDPEQGILKWPLSVMSIRQRTVIYQECLRRDLTACIRLTKVPGKGRAVFAADTILKDDFVVEYKGELCSEREAREREQRYNRSKVPMGSFMFYFKNGSRMMAIDATDEKQDFGPARLINHSRRNPNMTPRAITMGDFNSEPRLIFVARRNIEQGEELLVDYGERDPDVIKEHPWLNS
ncbi:putative SET domain-containing protein [Neospora caninum Liverpool]|uniref:Putative SET domain-containing protein n=1 Tax=Neospora caninum (strain Liverpool) TaxID=572307 RepID=F0VAI1_NEOCL|nr:putative SET domain-containing protein [Neospora caninum Liverpool]CBZ50670.1 putative SET domain-containing protein [Neospora caninum Liverpool]CEL65281.1 TPA: SET domain-containing protein, putative [Neospora caninum Liverpool]|eukprot:XP_003880703.1 putative SET domain-containing protein [Neospora caninum Liverpool]